MYAMSESYIKSSKGTSLMVCKCKISDLKLHQRKFDLQYGDFWNQQWSFEITINRRLLEQMN